MIRGPLQATAIAALTLIAAPARGAIFYVGAPGDRACSFSDIQAAIDHAASVPGPDVIRLVRTQPYTGQSLVISDSGDLNLVGGFDHCADGTASGHSTLEGSQGQSEPIITVRGLGTVKLRFLRLSGNHPGTGLDVHCPGCTVELLDSAVRDNGRGVYATTAGCAGVCPLQSRVRLGANVQVSANVGSECAGLLVRNAVFDMSHAPGSEVSANRAEFNGGGVCLREGALGLVAGQFSDNEAGWNGGAIEVSGTSRLLLYPTGPGSSPVLRDNRAGRWGGAISVESVSPDGETSVIGWDVLLESNSALEGGAVSVVSDAERESSATVCLRSLHAVPEADGLCPTRAPLEAVSCPGPLRCGYLGDNVAEYFGSAVRSQGPRTRVHLAHQHVGWNPGASTFGHFDPNDAPGESEIRIDDSAVLWGGDVATMVLLRAGRTTIRRSTITSASTPFFLNDCGDFELVDSIVWAPAEATLVRMGTSGANAARMVLASEVESLGGPSPDVQATADPGLESFGVATLRLDSPAIDFSDTTVNVRDLAGNPRGIGLSEAFDRFGPRDLGAFERQHEVILTEP